MTSGTRVEGEGGWQEAVGGRGSFFIFEYIWDRLEKYRKDSMFAVLFLLTMS